MSDLCCVGLLRTLAGAVQGSCGARQGLTEDRGAAFGDRVLCHMHTFPKPLLLRGIHTVPRSPQASKRRKQSIPRMLPAVLGGLAFISLVLEDSVSRL